MKATNKNSNKKIKRAEVIKIENSQIEKNSKKHIDNKTNIYYDIFTRKDIAKFTYYDYLYIEAQKKKQANYIQESQEKYEATSYNDINNKHDKTYREILGDKKYATYVINEALKLIQPIEEKEIEKYSNRYITSEYKDKETDVVYRIKDKEIYFLIEHQSKVDYSMSFRLEEYKLEIMRSAIDKEKVKTKEYEIPTVISIVIYTGKEKWTVKRELNKVQDIRLQKLNSQQYNLIDINKYTKEELLNSSNFVDKIFLMEKTENVDELRKILQKVEKQLSKEEKKKLIKIIRVNFTQKVGQEKIEEVIKEMEGEDEEMLACVEMVWEEGRGEGIKEGEKNKKTEIIKEMLRLGVNKEIICQATKINKKELEKIQKDNV